jgi:transposase
MAKRIEITIKESREELQKLVRSCAYYLRPRLKMLLALQGGLLTTQELVATLKVNKNSIAEWKKTYRASGLQALLQDQRGGNRPSILNGEQKRQLAAKLSHPKEGFTSYKQAQQWINETFSLAMNYFVVNQYLKRCFRTKLKVGRKSHVQKEALAAAAFKKPTHR